MWLWLILLGACGSSHPTDVEPELVTFTPVEGVQIPARLDYARELARVDATIERHRLQTLRRPKGVGAWIGLAGAHLIRARLAGGVADYEAADEAIAAAESLAPDAPLVWRQRASLLQSAHHFGEALMLLQRITRPTNADRASMASMRFELGHYTEAIDALKGLVDDPKDPRTPARLAACYSKLGDFDEAERLYDLAASRYHGREQWPVAWNHLVRGLMDLQRGRHDDALAHYRAAEKALPGWWLVEEHIAEIHLLQGRPAEAKAIYQRVVQATDSPELTGALADAEQALGELDAARRHRQQAKAAFTARLQEHPDLAGGHALDFLIEHGEPKVAVQVAQRNVRLRPNGATKLGLARALEKSGDGSSAKALREEVLASGWWTGP